MKWHAREHRRLRAHARRVPVDRIWLGFSAAAAACPCDSQVGIGVNTGNVVANPAAAGWPVPGRGILRRLIVFVSVNTVQADGAEVRVWKNGEPTEMAASYAQGSAGIVADLDTVVTLDAGDRLALVATNPGAAETEDLLVVTAAALEVIA